MSDVDTDVTSCVMLPQDPAEMMYIGIPFFTDLLSSFPNGAFTLALIANILYKNFCALAPVGSKSGRQEKVYCLLLKT